VSMLICDICSAPDPPWRYPAEDFIASETEGLSGILVQESIGGWAACDECRAIIDREDWHGLAVRAADTLLAQCAIFDRDWLIDEMIQLHQRFAASRRGPAERIDA
jgi:hypothetical protein